jgi:transposase
VVRKLQVRFRKPKLKHLRHIAIDEISIGSGHRYLTVVLGLDDGAVVFVGEGKGADSLLPFFKRLSASHARIKALALNKPLATVYYMKEDPRQIWDQQDKPAASRFIDDYDCPITTAALEGTNNKIKTMKRQAYGFRDREFFKLKIYALHETTYALVG